ncbi:hypothetical protein NUACC21_18270 [Scytonema sp. NUACC21]
MKSRIVRVFTVFLVTLIVLSPEIVVFGMIWEEHIDLVQTRALGCEAEQNYESKAKLVPMQKSRNSYSDKSQFQLFDTKFTKSSLNPIEKYRIVRIIQFFFLFFPILVGVFVILYDRYLIYRTAIFQQQVEMLERVWQQNIE